MSRVRSFALSAALALTAAPQSQAAEPAPLPRVDADAAAASFWRDQVHYPYPVHYAQGKDSQGRGWELAYLDEFTGPSAERERAPVLVLIHGRGMNAGYWGRTMSLALEQGVRVIAVDMPNYGKSIPGNLDKPFTRTLADVRAVLHDVLVRQLGVRQATWLGHSLGGQVALGFALDHPEAVERLVIYGTVLEELLPSRELPIFGGRDVPYADPALAGDAQAWERVWGPLGVLAKERALDRKAVEQQFFEGRRAGTLPYFQPDDPIGRFVVDARSGVIAAHPAEAERLALTNAWDPYAFAAELRKEDPENLMRRFPRLSMPVFLAYGRNEPAVPFTLFSGNPDLRSMLAPLAALPRPPRIKVYDQAGHFIHTDRPEAFAADVVAFVRTGAVPGPQYDPATDTAPQAAAAPAAAPEPAAAAEAAVPSNVPEELRAFARAAQEAFLSKDLERFMTLFHEDYRNHEGRDKAWQADYMRVQVMPFVFRWEYRISDAIIDGDRAQVKAEFVTEWGHFPGGAEMVKVDDRWLWIRGTE